MAEKLHKLSYSQIRLFQNCPRAFMYRYVDKIEPAADRPINLRAGAAMHKALETLYKVKASGLPVDRDAAIAGIDAEFAKSNLGDDSVLMARSKTRAMFDAYVLRYGGQAVDVTDGSACAPIDIDPEFEVVDVEREFEGPVVNPETGARSRTFEIGGKVDGIVRDRITGEYWLLEHKTARDIGADYIERLWTDYQVHLYVYYVRTILQIPVVGVIYNVVQTCQLVRSKPETEAEFAVRYAEACAANKSGKSSAKRNVGETWDEYEARCRAWYIEHADTAFLRVFRYLADEKVAEIQAAVWDIGQTMLDIRRADRYHRNPDRCFPLAGRVCDFEPLCRSCDNPIIRANLYRPRTELNEELGTPTDSGF